jgi:arylsulfatase A-like enzyme
VPETFLEAAGLPVPADMQGRSLLPLFAGQTPADWRKSFYYHYYEFPGPHSVRKHYGVVTDRYKLFHFYEPEVNYWTLIDRQSDPNEMRNVYDDPAHAAARAELYTELTRLRSELQVPEQDPPESYLRPGAGKGKKAGGKKAQAGKAAK